LKKVLQLPKLPLWLIVLGMLLPTISTYIYFDWLSHAEPFLQKLAYATSKISQFAVLALAMRLQWIFRQKSKLQTAPGLVTSSTTMWLPNASGILVGVGSGVAIGIAMVCTFQFILLPMGIMDLAMVEAKNKLKGLGADSPMILLAIASFYALLHSGFEELYWRGFVFQGLCSYVSTASAIALSSLAFMSHHVIVLAKYFGYASWLTYLLAAGVGIGGVIWALAQKHFSSLIPGWISHAIVDAAIFLIGYRMLFG
jgi:uncharacterized protein